MKIVKLIVVILLATVFWACKKDSSEKILPRLQSMIHLGQNASAKTEFHYHHDGKLKQTKHYINDKVDAYTDYFYKSAKVQSAKTYRVLSDASPVLVAETDFTYSEARLVRVEIKNLTSSSTQNEPIVYNFTYPDGAIPTATITFPRLTIPNPFLDRWRSPDQGSYVLEEHTPTNPTQSIPMRDYEFDHNPNPLYNQPYLSARRFVGLPNGYFAVSFDVLGFFFPNNLTVANLSQYTVENIEYDYNKFGQPIKSFRTNSSTPGSKIETVYEYSE